MMMAATVELALCCTALRSLWCQSGLRSKWITRETANGATPNSFGRGPTWRYRDPFTDVSSIVANCSKSSIQ